MIWSAHRAYRLFRSVGGQGAAGLHRMGHAEIKATGSQRQVDSA
jgi:hypothetical protein